MGAIAESSDEKQGGKRKREVDYRWVFLMGIIFLAVGAGVIGGVGLLFGTAFLALGVVWMAIGLAHKDKRGESPTGA